MPKTIKCLLASFLTEEGKRLLLPKIAEAVPIVNQLVTETYHLMGLHFRRMLEQDPNWTPPSIADEYVLRFMRILHGAKRYIPEVDILETKHKIYDPLRAAAGLPLLVTPWPKGLDQIKKYAAIEISTHIRNNVLVHFPGRVKKFIAFLHPEMDASARARLLDRWWECSHSNCHPRLFPRPDLLVGSNNSSVEYSLTAAPELFIPGMWYMLQTYENYNSIHAEPHVTCMLPAL